MESAGRGRNLCFRLGNGLSRCAPVNAPVKARWTDHLLLQGIIVLWGFTAVLGKLIAMESLPLVAWRTGMAAVALALMMGWGKLRRFGTRLDVWQALGTGCLIGFHWYLFFLAGRLGNVSTGLAGAATAALWVALLEPLVVRGRRVHVGECVLALVVAAGVAVITGSEGVSLPSFFTGVAAAAVAALFSICNGRLVRRLPAIPLTCLELAAASGFTAVLALMTVRPLSVATLVPSEGDWVPLLVLSLVCTVFAFSACVWLQQRISAFTVGLAGNLEPVYGMLLALAVFGSSEQMGPRFYAGAAVIIGCVAVHALGGMRRGGEGSEGAEN